MERAVPILPVDDPAGMTRKPLPQWLLEGLFIVISVLLGFAVAQFGEYRADRQLVARVLAGVQAEMEQNLARLEPFVPVHRQWVRALSEPQPDANQSAFDVFVRLRPALPAGIESSFPALERSAWDTAVAGGALRLVDYEVAALLADVYRIQEIASANIERRLADSMLSSTETYEVPARPAAIAALRYTLLDIASAESALLERYRANLPRITAAATAAR